MNPDHVVVRAVSEVVLGKVLNKNSNNARERGQQQRMEEMILSSSYNDRIGRPSPSPTFSLGIKKNVNVVVPESVVIHLNLQRSPKAVPAVKEEAIASVVDSVLADPDLAEKHPLLLLTRWKEMKALVVIWGEKHPLLFLLQACSITRTLLYLQVVLVVMTLLIPVQRLAFIIMIIFITIVRLHCLSILIIRCFVRFRTESLRIFIKQPKSIILEL
jgi:hypothetical protein